MIKKSIFLILLIFSCSQKNKKIKVADDKNVTRKEITREIKKNSAKDSPIIDFIHKFGMQDDYYLTLYSRNDYSIELDKVLQNSISDSILYNGEPIRRLVSDSIISKHFNIDATEKLIVIDKNSRVVDTIKRKQYEYNDDAIESYYVATYDLNNQNKSDRYIVSSMFSDSIVSFCKPVNVKEYSSFLSKKVLKNLSFNTEHLYSSMYFINGVDTIKLISFADYSKGGTKMYLFKNNIPKDSLTNSFILNEFTPIPLQTKNEFLFLASVNIPDTDAFWDVLTGIDKERIKFYFYEKNRLYKK